MKAGGRVVVTRWTEVDMLVDLGVPPEDILMIGGEGSGREAQSGHQEGQAAEAEQAEEEVNSSL